MSVSAWTALGDRGRFVIPQAVREDQDLKPGDRLIVISDEHGMTVMTRDQLEAKVWAENKHPEISLVDQLIAERHAEALRDVEDN